MLQLQGSARLHSMFNYTQPNYKNGNRAQQNEMRRNASIKTDNKTSIQTLLVAAQRPSLITWACSAALPRAV